MSERSAAYDSGSPTGAQGEDESGNVDAGLTTSPSSPSSAAEGRDPTLDTLDALASDEVGDIIQRRLREQAATQDRVCARCGHAETLHAPGGGACEVEVCDYGNLDCFCIRFVPERQTAATPSGEAA